VRTRPALAVSAALVLLAGTYGPAVAAGSDADDQPSAVGAASSSLSLLDVTLGDASVRLLDLALRSESGAGAPSTSFVVTPLALDGAAYGRQSLSSRSAALPGVDSRRFAPAALSAVASASSPSIDVTVEGATSRAAATTLGGASVLGIPVRLDGAVEISSSSAATGSAGSKTLTLTQLALPSVADLLAAAGLDLQALPAASLTGLLNRLDLDSSATREAEQALRDALGGSAPAYDTAVASVVDATDAVVAAAEQRADARATLAAATASLNDAAAALSGSSGGALRRTGSLIGLDPITSVLDPVLAPVTEVVAPVEDGTSTIVNTGEELVVDAVVEPVLEPVVDSSVDSVLSPVLKPVVEPVTEAVEPVLEPVLEPLESVVALPGLEPLAEAYAAAQAAYNQALAGFTSAEATLGLARQTLADARATVAALLAPVAPQVEALVSSVRGVLDATPLVSIERLEVTTRSAVTSAASGGQTAQVVGGRVQGLRVLGTDVLLSALGSSDVDVLDLAGPALQSVDRTVGQLTGALSSALSSVPGLPGLSVPAPKVQLLSSATTTDVVDGFGVAGSALRALTVTWPGIALPVEAALPDAATLPSVVGLPRLSGLSAFGAARVPAPGDLLTQPLTLTVATLEDRARFRPAAVLSDAGDGSSTGGGDSSGSAAPASPGPGAAPADGPVTGRGAPQDTPTTGTGTPDHGTPAQPRTTPVGLTELPRTGADALPAALALLLVAAGLVLHRRRTV
jgi:hypothetical protein